MTTVTVTTGNPDIQISFNGSTFYYPASSSKADYSVQNDTMTLQCPPIGLSIAFPSASYNFIINGVGWAGGFTLLAEEFNNNIFTSATISPIPTSATTIRANAITTGAYVATSSIQATGRSQVHFDFDITDGGTLGDNGCIIAIIQVSDDNATWKNLNNVVPASALVADGATSPFQSGTVFRQFTAEYAAISIPYLNAALPSLPIRISYSTGYGKFYRLQVRASDTGGISTGAPATFPDLEIKATLQ